MGAASSSNVSQAVTNVSNYVSASTTADQEQVSKIEQTQVFSDCTVTGDVRVTNIAEVQIASQQILEGIQTADLQNNIAQQMMQEAQSTVGSMGIGYAEASNSASAFANASSTVINSVEATSQQGSEVSQTFICDGSHLYGDVDINNTTQSSFLSDQTLKQSQTATIVNDVSQVISQKATAKVEGLAGFLVALALCIVALGVGFGGALKGAGDAAKPLLIAGTALGLACLMAWMYVAKAPPLFSENDDCCPVDTAIGGGGGECINVKQQSLQLKSPPLRYIYYLNETIPLSSTNPGSLLKMALARVGNSPDAQYNNGGYNAYSALKLDLIKDDTAEYVGILPCPDLAVISTNEDGYVYAINDDYLADGGCSPGVMTKTLWGDASADGEDQCKMTTHSEEPELFDIGDGVPKKYIPSEGIDEISGLTDAEQRMILAESNESAWNAYLKCATGYEEFKAGDNDTQQNRQLHARFYLCRKCGINSTYTYVYANEEVQFNDPTGNQNVEVFGTVGGGKWWYRDTNGEITEYEDPERAAKYAYLYTGFSQWNDKTAPIDYPGGELHGQFGVVDNREYQLHKAMKSWGIWVALGIIIILFIMMGTHGKTWGKGTGGGAKPTPKPTPKAK